jgi:hypothetical protein
MDEADEPVLACGGGMQQMDEAGNTPPAIVMRDARARAKRKEAMPNA